MHKQCLLCGAVVQSEELKPYCEPCRLMLRELGVKKYDLATEKQLDDLRSMRKASRFGHKPRR